MLRSKALSEVILAGGFYPAHWHQEASAQTVVCIHDDGTDGGNGGCRIFPHRETGSQWNSRFAAGDAWLLLARAERFQTRSPRLRGHLHVAPRVSHRLSVTWGMQQVGGLLSGSCIVWALGTVLRQLKRFVQDTVPTPRVVGIDDWTWRKSQTYATIIVDLERRAVIDIRADRSVESCAKWRRQHPEIEVVSRDRCGLYAKAAIQGAPQAAQVADRSHLVQHLRQAIEEQMNMHGRATGRALLSDADNISTANHLLRSRLAHRQSREEIFKSIHELRKQGLSCSEIGRRTGSLRCSVSKWLQSEAPPDRRRATLKPTSLWCFEGALADLWAQGIRCDRDLLVEIQRQGYEGSLSHLQRLLAGRRRAERTGPAGPTDNALPLALVRNPQTGHAISPTVAAALCIKPRRKLAADQAQKVDA